MTELIQSIHHVSLIVSDTERSLGFYRDLLGLQLETGRTSATRAPGCGSASNSYTCWNCPTRTPLRGAPPMGDVIATWPYGLVTTAGYLTG